MGFWRLWAYLVWLDYGRHSAHEDVSWGCPICMLVFWRVLCNAGLMGASPVVVALRETGVTSAQAIYGAQQLQDTLRMAMRPALNDAWRKRA